MTKNNNHLTNCTTFFPNYQLFLPMDIGVNIPESSPVRVISRLLEGLDYRNLMQAYSKNKGGKYKIEANANKYTFVWKKNETYKVSAMLFYTAMDILYKTAINMSKNSIENIPKILTEISNKKNNND